MLIQSFYYYYCCGAHKLCDHPPIHFYCEILTVGILIWLRITFKVVNLLNGHFLQIDLWSFGWSVWAHACNEYMVWYKGARPATLPCQNMCATIFGVCKIEMSNCIRLILMSTLTYDNSYNYLLLALCFVCFFWHCWRRKRAKECGDLESRCRAHSARCRRCICSQLTSNLSFSYFIQSRLNRLLILIFSIDVDLLSFVAFFVVAGPVVVVADRLHGLAHGNTILYYTLCLGCQFFSPFRFVLVIFVLFLFYFIFCCLFFCFDSTCCSKF